MRRLWAFLRRDLLHETSYRLSFVLQLLGILPVLILFFFVSRLVGDNASGPLDAYGGRYFPFVLVGIAMERYLVLSLGTFSRGLREAQLAGTLEAVLVTPVSVPMLLAGSTLYSFGFNALRVLAYLAAGSLLFGVELEWARLPAVLALLGLTILAFAGLGILSASFTILFKRGDPVTWGFSVISWVIGGVYFPVSMLPDGLRTLAALLPITHALEALRRTLLPGAAAGASVGTAVRPLFALALWTLVVLPASVVIFRFALDRARNQGTLGHY